MTVTGKNGAAPGGFWIGDIVRLPSGRLGRVENRSGAALRIAYLDTPGEELRILPQHVVPAPGSGRPRKRR